MNKITLDFTNRKMCFEMEGGRTSCCLNYVLDDDEYHISSLSVSGLKASEQVEIKKMANEGYGGRAIIID